MAHLVGYGMLAVGDSSYHGHLAKAQCDFCGRLFGSLEDAKRCEAKHINAMLNNLGVRPAEGAGGDIERTEENRK